VRLAGFLLLVSGWVLVAAALLLLTALTPRAAFVLAGVAVEILGFALVARAHLPSKADPHAR
jgi:membrane-bound ClpP family serine protease